MAKWSFIFMRAMMLHKDEGLFLVSRMVIFPIPRSVSKPPVIYKEYRPDEKRGFTGVISSGREIKQRLEYVTGNGEKEWD